VNSSAPDTNYGNEERFYVGATDESMPFFNAYFHFNFSDRPDIFEKAEISITFENVMYTLDFDGTIFFNPSPFICKKLLNIKRVPAGWSHRREREYEWDLIVDKENPQPLGVYIKELNVQVDNRYKNGYQASLGGFAGRWCRIAPLRSTLQEAFKDCFEFMKAHNEMCLLRVQLDEQYFIQNYSTSIF